MEPLTTLTVLGIVALAALTAASAVRWTAHRVRDVEARLEELVRTDPLGVATVREQETA